MIEACLLDLDGVLVDVTQGALRLHGVVATNAEFWAGRAGVYYMQEMLGMPSRDFWLPMDEEFWAGLGWMPDGEEILRLVEGRFGRERVVLASTPTPNRGCWDGKRRWIERHLPGHYHQVGSQMFGSRKHLMANGESILVDDHDENLDLFEATRGGRVCRVPRLWNRLHSLSDRSLELVRAQLEAVS